MFYDLERKQKNMVSVVIFLAVYLIAGVLFSIDRVFTAQNFWHGLLAAITHLWWAKGIVATLMVFFLVYYRNTSLDVEAKKVGHGQHGSAAFMNESEVKECYSRVGFGSENKPAFLVGQDSKGWLVDDSDHNILLLAPPGGGKTKRIYIPSIYYNAEVNRNTGGRGASMVIMDIKGELYRSCSGFLKDAGYRTPVLNFRDIAQSSKYQLLYKVNRAMDKYLEAASPGQKAIYYGQAERFAKVLSTSLVDNIENTVKSDTSDYFNETAKGLLTGIILLVSEYAQPKERHIVSVFSLILEMNGQSQAQPAMFGGVQQKSKLDELLEHIGNRRIRNYTGAATSADMRTLMNVFSSALSKLTKFIDAELEQLVCEHSPDLDDFDFIKHPTAIFIICPDENTTRHFFASLFIRYFSNDLIEQAENIYNGELPRKVLYFCDEFGNLPPINDVDVLFAAVRSRGVRIMISLQSYAQLYKAYTKERADIIKDTCQMVMSGFVAPSSYDTAKNLSEMLGNKTVLSASVAKDVNRTNVTHSMVGKPLVSLAEWVTLPHGTFVVMKGGYKPIKTMLQLFFEYLDVKPQKQEKPKELEYVYVQVATGDKLIRYLSGNQLPLAVGMFD